MMSRGIASTFSLYFFVSPSVNFSIISCTSTYWERSTGKYSEALAEIRSSILLSFTAGMITSLVAMRLELMTKTTFLVVIFLLFNSACNTLANSSESFCSNILLGVENKNELYIFVSLPPQDTSRTLTRLRPHSILSTLFSMLFSKLKFIVYIKNCLNTIL